VRRRDFIALLGCAAAIQPLLARAERPPQRILYFTHSAGYRHEVIPLSKAILTQLGRNSAAFEITATEDTSEFSTENLKRYAGVMFYTSGELPMSGAEKAALLDFVRSGGGFLGVHSATDTFYAWADYLDLIGGYFNGHPWHQAVTIEVADPGDPLVAFLGKTLQIDDEIYQINDFDHRGSHVLLRLDPNSVVQNRGAAPILWLASRLDPILRPGASILYGAWPRGLSLARRPLSANPHKRDPVVDAKIALGLIQLLKAAAFFAIQAGNSRSNRQARMA
jgi:type 1 glutamine amidotransferase